MTKYKSKRIIDGILKWVVIENEIVINKDPTKDELKDLKTKQYKTGEKYTDEELLNYFKQFYEKNGRVPVKNDFNNNPRYPNFGTYINHFGSWNKALEMSELDMKKRFEKYTDEELLNYLKIFKQENGRIPTTRYFDSHPGNPYSAIYWKRFGSWDNALKLVGMDLDTRVMQGYLKTETEKGRYTEIMVRKMFDNKGVDSSGEDCSNYHDGICPTGQIYEVKSSGLRDGIYWLFSTENKDKDDNKEAIQWYYFVAVNKDYTKLIYMWRVPGELVEEDRFRVGTGIYGKFNTESMKEYDITEKFKKIITDKNDDILSKLIN